MTIKLVRFMPLVCLTALCGCAGLRFHDAPTSGAFTYYEPQPFLVIKQAADCSFTSEVTTLPGAKRAVSFVSGLGSSKLSVKVANGIITDIGQETDTKVPETITALTGLAKQAGIGAQNLAPGAKPACAAKVSLHAIGTDGKGKVTIERQAAFEQ